MPSSRIVDRVRMFDNSPKVKQQQQQQQQNEQAQAAAASDQVPPRQQQNPKSSLRYSSPGRAAAALARSRHRHHDNSTTKSSRASPTAADGGKAPKDMALVNVPHMEEHRQDVETNHRHEEEGMSSNNIMPHQSRPLLPSPTKSPAKSAAAATAPRRGRVPRRSLSPSPRERKVQDSPPPPPASSSSSGGRVNQGKKSSPSYDRSTRDDDNVSTKPPSPNIIGVPGQGQAMAARRQHFEANRKSSSPAAAREDDDVVTKATKVVHMDRGGAVHNSTAARAVSRNYSPATIPKSPSTTSNTSSSVRARALQNMRRHRRSPSPSTQSAADDSNSQVGSAPSPSATVVKLESDQRTKSTSSQSSSSPGRTMYRRQHHGSPTVTTQSSSTSNDSDSPCKPNFKNRPALLVSGRTATTARKMDHAHQSPSSSANHNHNKTTEEQSPSVLRPKTCLPSTVRALRHIGTRNQCPPSSPVMNENSAVIVVVTNQQPITASANRAAAIRQQFEGQTNRLAPCYPGGNSKPSEVADGGSGGRTASRPLKRIVSPRQAAVLRQVEARNHASSPSASETGGNGSNSLVDSKVQQNSTTPRSAESAADDADNKQPIRESPNHHSPSATTTTRASKPPQSKYYSLYEKTLVDIQSNKEKSPASNKQHGNNNYGGGHSRSPVVVKPRSPAPRPFTDHHGTPTKSPAKKDSVSHFDPNSATGSSRSRPLPVAVDNKMAPRRRASPLPSSEVTSSPVDSEKRPRSEESSRSASSPRPAMANNTAAMRRLEGTSASSPVPIKRGDARSRSKSESPKFATFPIAGNYRIANQNGSSDMESPNLARSRSKSESPKVATFPKAGNYRIANQNGSAQIDSQNFVGPPNRPVNRSTLQHTPPGASNASQPLKKSTATPSKYYSAYAQKMSDGVKRTSLAHYQREQASYSQNKPSSALNDSTRNSSTSRLSRLMDIRARSPALRRGFNTELKWNLDAATVVMQEEKASSVASSTSSTRSSLSNEELGIIASRAMRLGQVSSVDTKASNGNGSKLPRQSPLQQMHAFNNMQPAAADEATYQNGQLNSRGSIINGEAHIQSMPLQKAQLLESGSAFSSTKPPDTVKTVNDVANSKEPVLHATSTRLFDRLSKADRYAIRMKQRKGVLVATDAGMKGDAAQVNGSSATSVRQIRREGMARAAKQASRENQEPADRSLTMEDSLNRSMSVAHSRRQKARELARKFEQRKNDTQKNPKGRIANSLGGSNVSTSPQALATLQTPYAQDHFASHAHHQNVRSFPIRAVNQQKEQISPAEDSWKEREQDRLTPSGGTIFSIEQNFSPSRARHADDSDGADEPWQPDVSRSYNSPSRNGRRANSLEVLAQELQDHGDVSVSPSCSISPSKKTDYGDIKPGDTKPALRSMSPGSRKQSNVGSPGTPESLSRFQSTRSKFESPQSQSARPHEEGRRGGSPSSSNQPRRSQEEIRRDGSPSPSFNSKFQRPQLYPDERRYSASTTDGADMWDIAHKAGYTRFDDTQYQEAMNPFALSSDYTSTSFHTFDESFTDPGRNEEHGIVNDADQGPPATSSDLSEEPGTVPTETRQVSDSTTSVEPEEVPTTSDECEVDNVVASSDFSEESEASTDLNRPSASDDSAQPLTSNEKSDMDEDVSSTVASDVDNSMLMGEGFAEDSSHKTSSADEAGKSNERRQAVYSSSSSSHFSKSTISKDEMAKTFSRYTVSSTMARIEPISDEENIPASKKVHSDSPLSAVQQRIEKPKSRLVELTEKGIKSETVKVQSNDLQWPANASEDTIRWWQQNYAKKGEEKTNASTSSRKPKSPRITEKDDEDVFSGLEEDVKGEDDPGDHVGYSGHEDSSDEEQENQPYPGMQSSCRTPGSTRTRASSYYNGISLEEFSSLPPPPPPPLPPPPPPPPRSAAVLQPKTMNQNSSDVSPIATGIDESKIAKQISSGMSSPGKRYGYSPRDRDTVETIEEEASESSSSSGPEEASEDEISVDKSSEEEVSDEGSVGRGNGRKDIFHSGKTIEQSSGNKTPTSDITSSLITTNLQKIQYPRPKSVEKEITKSESSGSEGEHDKSKNKHLISLPTNNSGISPANSGEMGSVASDDDGVIDNNAPEADGGTFGNFKTKNSAAQNSPGAIFMTIGYSIVDSITTVCRMPESIPQLAECGANNTTDDFFERARSKATDFTCRCAPDDVNNQTASTSFPFNAENVPATGSYAGLNDNERRVWNEWEIRDKKGAIDERPDEQPIQVPPRQSSPRELSPHPAPPRQQTEESSESSSQNRIQHEQKRKLAQEQLLLHARKAKELEFPGQKALSILTENTGKNPIEAVPIATESALSNTQRLVLERFSTMLRNERVEVLKLNRHEKWQLRYLTVSKEVSWIRGDENPSDVGQCPQALLWFKTPHSKHGGVASQGRGGFKFTQLLRISRDSREEPKVLIPKKLQAKFPDYVGVKITYAYEGGSRDLVFCLRDTAEARAFCTAMEIIREVVQREEKVLEAAATRSPSQNSSASSAGERRPRRPSPRFLARSPRKNGGGNSETRKT